MLELYVWTWQRDVDIFTATLYSVGKLLCKFELSVASLPTYKPERNTERGDDDMQWFNVHLKADLNEASLA